MIVLTYSTIVILLVVYPFTINGFGAILSLPPATSTAQPKGKTTGPIIHIWQNCKAGYRMETSMSSTSTTNKYTVKVTYENALIEVVESDRFDGELTLSIKMKSYNDSVHITEYLLAEKKCIRRYYIATKDKKGVEKKYDEDCDFPSEPGSLGSTVNQKNCWIWKDSLFEGWGKGKLGTWGGAVQELPAIGAAPDPGFAKAFKLHKWNNVLPNYHMTVYRVAKDKHDDQHFVAMWFKDKLLQDRVKVYRFDDDLLNSITVMQSQTADIHYISYKHHDGSCKHRTYVMSGAKPQVTETNCFQFTINKLLNYVLHPAAVNGWTW